MSSFLETLNSTDVLWAYKLWGALFFVNIVCVTLCNSDPPHPPRTSLRALKCQKQPSSTQEPPCTPWTVLSDVSGREPSVCFQYNYCKCSLFVNCFGTFPLFWMGSQGGILQILIFAVIHEGLGCSFSIKPGSLLGQVDQFSAHSYMLSADLVRLTGVNILTKSTILCGASSTTKGWHRLKGDLLREGFTGASLCSHTTTEAVMKTQAAESLSHGFCFIFF